ncbi:hypothetical protein HK15_01445 [Acetobacter orientalis]|uniref:Uncharacterized protein n=1 Tax=Acetobacter orientalis TaxID=146474 RepID=A0A252BFC8_9PROT|nr:hypothetical protein [Acetobacter orientalis]OUJ03115.1 hypothetical protein HK15_01445 [Acetobacter orientalis]
MCDEEKINDLVSKDNRISKKMLSSLSRDEVNLYAYLRGMKEHILCPAFGFGIPFDSVIEYTNADLDVVADYIRDRVEDAEEALEDLYNITELRRLDDA